MRHFVDHRFDLLGSGWVQVRHGMRCRGFEGFSFDLRSAGPYADIGRANRAASLAVQAQLSPGYQPIDWQLDFKSGYRWSERTWYRDIRYGAIAAADVKVPWELSRMQHLPELAVVYSIDRNPRLVREFCDQVLDWIAANPPRFGVNWACTMDVGIRVANWLIAFDLLRAADAQFAPEFVQLFSACILDHARHIASNLEWSETRRANHYFGNIGGLLLAAAYLPASDQTDAWLLFCVQELMVEAERQFLADGGHFEASTSYHRLCAEIVAVCAAFVAALPAVRVEGALRVTPRRMPHGPGLRRTTFAMLAHNYAATGSLLKAEFGCRLGRAAEFTRTLTRPDGSVATIGDDDSGRFVRLGGWVAAGSVAECRAKFLNLDTFSELPDTTIYLMQSTATHQQWLAWAGAVLGRSDLLDPAWADIWGMPHALATALVRKPLRERTPNTAVAGVSAPSGAPNDRTAVNAAVTHRVSGTYGADGDLLGNVRYESYPVFGVYIVRSDRIHLVIRCGNGINDGFGVHAHEDQLAIDLVVDGRVIAADPGTYVYTPSQQQRNAYRSARAHHAPVADGPSAVEPRQIFSGPAHARGDCLQFGPGKFIGIASVDGGEVMRTIELYGDRIEIHDEYRLQQAWRPASSNPFAPASPVPFSPSYGVRAR